MATWTNTSKNTTTYTLIPRGFTSVTWDEATFTWDEAEGTWDSPREPWTKVSKNSSTYFTYFRHNKQPTMLQIANKVFTDTIFLDGTILRDVTFAQFADQVWTKASKNSASYVLVTKN